MNRLVIFVKAPIPGRVKTRLCPPLTHEQAAALYRAFVRDTLEAVREFEGARIEVAYQPGDCYPDLTWLEAPQKVPFFFQQGPGLGAKIIHAFHHAFGSGAEKAVVLGSDTPQLAPEELREAFRLLDRRDVVLGPAADGGYYLVGLRRPAPALFEGISWSTSQVLRQTLRRMEGLELSCGLLPEYRDMDTFADLETLARLAGTGSRSRLRFTFQALRCNIPALAPTDYQRTRLP